MTNGYYLTNFNYFCKKNFGVLYILNNIYHKYIAL